MSRTVSVGAAYQDACERTKKDQAMRFYIFKSETTDELRAFAGDEAGTKLPDNHGPWTVTGVVTAEAIPPHNLSRDAIEEAIEVEGFQLWRMRKKTKAAPARA